MNRFLGHPWQQDYGTARDLVFPIGIIDRPFKHDQPPWTVDTSGPGANVLILGAGGSGGLDQRVAQLTQPGGPGALVDRGRHVLGRAAHLVDAIGQVGRVVGGQHHGILGHRRGAVPVQRAALLVGPLPAGLAAVLAATAHARVGDVATAPAAGLRMGTAAHACRL